MNIKAMQKLITILILIFVVGCGSSGRKEVPLALYSDPLGAYAILKVDYSDNRESDWIFLGPTPVKVSKSIDLKKARKVTIRVIRENFKDQTKSWTAKEFIQLSRDGDKIFWSPAMVRN